MTVAAVVGGVVVGGTLTVVCGASVVGVVVVSGRIVVVVVAAFDFVVEVVATAVVEELWVTRAVTATAATATIATMATTIHPVRRTLTVATVLVDLGHVHRHDLEHYRQRCDE
jgi:hypothetical protein